jgi:hypothetical protein
MSSEHQTHQDSGFNWKTYVPLLVIIVLTFLASIARQIDYGTWNGIQWMHDFMGFFLVVFSMFKLFDLPGFADGFQMYDLLAKPFRPYAYLYPFIELGLGLGYLSMWQPDIIYIATLIVFGFGALGVIWALIKGLHTMCACLGTVLKVPLSTVALVEDLAMVVMAAAMLFWHRG